MRITSVAPVTITDTVGVPLRRPTRSNTRGASALRAIANG